MGGSGSVEERLDELSDIINSGDLTPKESADTAIVLQMARLMLCRYEGRKNAYDILAELVSILEDTSESLAEVDDKIAETVLSAKTVLDDIIEAGRRYVTDHSIDRFGENNLTRYSTYPHTPQYQQKGVEIYEERRNESSTART